MISAIVRLFTMNKVSRIEYGGGEVISTTCDTTLLPMQTILVVDDVPENILVVGSLLRPFYHVRVANSGAHALRAAVIAPRPDLILLDVMMPDMSGYTVLEKLKQDPATRNIPVIFLSAMDEEEDEERGLSMGAVDYITKPIRPLVLKTRVRTHIELSEAQHRLQQHNASLEQEVAHRMLENEVVKDVSLYALALLAEARDPETGNHLQRTRAYVDALSRKLADHPRFSILKDEAWRSMIVKAAPLHDIGKVGIPDHILLKPGKLSESEYACMQTHASIGGEAIAMAMRRVGEDFGLRRTPADHQQSLAFLEIARQIASGHHERWDGSGYPAKLSGELIPLPARLMALADVYDALINRRVYKDALPSDEVDAIIAAGRGKHFDPDIVDAYFEIRPEFLAITEKFSDFDGKDVSHGRDSQTEKAAALP